MINWRIRADCTRLSRPSPARRPRRLGFSARKPPARSSAIHLLTARRLAPNTSAARSWFMPPRTACTTERRKCVCVAISNFRASAFLCMPQMTSHYALFDARISKSLLDCSRFDRIAANECRDVAQHRLQASQRSRESADQRVMACSIVNPESYGYARRA